MTTNSEVFKQLNQRINALERNNKTLKVLFFLFVFVAFLLAAYIVYIEVATPPFGKWRFLRQEKLQTQQFNDYLLSRIDSISRSNDLLMENSPYYSGVFFEVQIGAFENFDLEAYQEALENLHFYKEDSLNKYVLGKFRNYQKAKAFQKDMMRMGVEDAFVIGKINGERVEITQAIKAAEKQKW